MDATQISAITDVFAVAAIITGMAALYAVTASLRLTRVGGSWVLRSIKG